MPKVIFFTFQSQEVAQLLIRHAPRDYEILVHPMTLPDEEKIPLVRDADFLILHPSQISERVLRSAGNVKLIQLVSAGFEKMDLPLCRELEIPVANSGGTNSVDAAEHTIALILCFYRRLIEFDRSMRVPRWKGVDAGVSTYTINGKTLGIVGLGHVGRHVARLARAFDARVIYYDKHMVSPEMEQELGVSPAGLEALLQKSDIVTLHVPLTNKTRGLIGQKQLYLMKPASLLINTCRAQVVDEAALIAALKEKRILGAALDVIEKIPPDPENPMLKLDNLILTPHVAGLTYDTWERRGDFIFRNLRRVWDGNAPLSVVQEASG